MSLPRIFRLLVFAGALFISSLVNFASRHRTGYCRESRPRTNAGSRQSNTTFLNNPLETRLRPEMLALEWQSRLQLNEYTLSLVDINQVPIVLAYEIIQYDKVLFCRDIKRWWHEENRIYSRMELDIVYSMRHYA